MIGAQKGFIPDRAEGFSVRSVGAMRKAIAGTAWPDGRFWRHLPRRAAVLCTLVCACLGFSRATQDANANGETRTLTMVHSHTGEQLTITYKREGSFDSSALEKLNWFLRDWRVDEPISMAPNLFDIIWYVYREVGAHEPIRIMSAYRSPGTNAMLRRRSRAVAKESQHMRGNAMDIHIPGVGMGKVREIGMRLQRGGVGYYPNAGSPFVHLDVGSVRSWPRMNRDQLERLFPDGKTVHLPADGTPLANYQLALAEIQARGGSALDYDTVTSNRGKSLWAMLFGGEEDEEIVQPTGRGRNARVAANNRGGSRNEPQQVASVVTSGDHVSSWGTAPSAPVETTASRPAPSRAVRSQTIIAPSPEEAAAPTANALSPPSPAPVSPAAKPEKTEPALQIASLPVPPIRPRGLQFDRMVATSEPLPPIRPTELIAALSPPHNHAAPVPAAPAPAAQIVTGIPLPPMRPAIAAHSVAEARATLPAIVSRASEPEPPAGPTRSSYAATEAPPPPSRPQGAPTQPAVLPGSTVIAHAIPKVTPPRRPAAHPLLAAQAEHEVRPASRLSVPERPVDREVKSVVMARKLTPAGAAAPTGSAFSGSFIRPMNSFSFTKRGE